MNNSLKHIFSIPPEQKAIRDKCFHPSGTFVEFPTEDVVTSIPARFEKIVSIYPDRLAVKMGEESVTYNELNQAANRIARAILSISGKDSRPVALLLGLGIDLIAAIFGSLKAGKCHTALDPSFPQERIAHILDDSQASLIVTDKCIADLARKLTNHKRPLLSISEIDRAFPDNDLALPILPTDLAKIRYTSGSTGKPQGVGRTHQDMLWRAMSITNNEMHTCAGDRLTLLHYPSFASADNHLFSSLLNGATLYPFDIKSQGISRVAKWLADEQITVYHSPPAVFRQFAETISSGEIPSLRLIYLSGAPITRQDFELYKAKFADGTLLEIGMGSTEARRVSGALVEKTFCFPDQGSPVGYPRSDIKVLLLDDNSQEVTAGEIGEIALKGPYVDPGYWNQKRSEMSPDPDSSGDRLYLTGDLGRMLPDGFLIHLGRKDLMVKIRGYRVNLDEVEAALLEHPQVNEAGVAARERDPGEKYLVGYIIPRKGAALNASDLNKFLGEKLPDYMIPSAFMFLESLPLTNGKLNRSALPKPDNKRPEIRMLYVSPTDDLEHKLSLLWSDILSLDRVGIHDNFFDLGGHSLAATRVLSQVIRIFKVELPLQSLFQSPTVAEMAAVIRKQQENKPRYGELEGVLEVLESMSDEEAQRLLERERIK